MKAWLVSSSVLILAIILLRALFKKRISPSLRYALWLPVLLRLLLPFNIGESAVSVLNYIPSIELSEPAPVQNENLILNFGEETPFSPYNDELTVGEQSQTVPDSTGATKSETGVKDLIFPLYLTGAAMVFSALLFSNQRFASSLRKSRRDAGSFMGLPVYKSAGLDSPCLFGLLRPAIYLSEDVDDNSCKHVLMHEQAHYRQKDHVWAWLRGVALALHWYNPLVWLAARLSKQDSELSCDEKVIASIDSAERISYGKTLISLSCVSGKPLLCAVAPLSSKGRALKERVEYVAKRPGTFLGSMALVLVAALIVSGCSFSGAKPDGAETAIPISPEEKNQQIHQPGGALLDRDGKALTADNFQLYDSAVSAFELYLENGSTVSMTIDLDLQQKAQALLEQYISSTEEYIHSGCVVALDVKTGAPLAIAGKGELVDPLAISFSPGSLFYPCTAITALDVGVIDPEYKIKCEGAFDRYAQDGISLECWIHEKTGMTHPEENLSAALRDSCEYYFYCLGNDCGIDDIEKTAHVLGLGVHSGIELPSGTGMMPSRVAAKNYGMNWTIGNTLETAVGEGLCSFTPLQLAQYCAAIANNGTRYSASVVAEITDREGQSSHRRSPLVLSQVTNVTDGGWTAVKEGLNMKLNSEDALFQQAISQTLGDWRVAGTISSSSTGGMLYKNIFMGFAPYDEPEIALALVSITDEAQGPTLQMAYDFISEYKNMQ